MLRLQFRKQFIPGRWDKLHGRIQADLDLYRIQRYVRVDGSGPCHNPIKQVQPIHNGICGVTSPLVRLPISPKSRFAFGRSHLSIPNLFWIPWDHLYAITKIILFSQRYSFPSSSAQ